MQTTFTFQGFTFIVTRNADKVLVFRDAKTPGTWKVVQEEMAREWNHFQFKRNLADACWRLNRQERRK